MDSYFPTVLSNHSKSLLLKEDSKLLLFFGCWQAICIYSIQVGGLWHPKIGLFVRC
jgi:hypothetical protein